MTNKNFVVDTLERLYFDKDYSTEDEAYAEAQKQAFKSRQDYGVFKLVTAACINSQQKENLVSRLNA